MLLAMKILERWILALIVFIAVSPPGLWASEFKVDKKRSSVTVDVKATGDDFTAHLEDYMVHIMIDDGTHQPTNAVFKWDFKNLKTGKDKRDEKMLEWMGVPKYSQASFTFEKWEVKKGETYATGIMEMHGIKKSLTFPVTLKQEAKEMTIMGQAKMDYQDFNLKIIRMMLLFKVNPQLVISFELKGVLVP